ncbi:DUF1007 family protein [Vibrio kyushuensis]|uniref:DUF1007 family protein n=1 Tax=Vibrio kyushuensis TaxID=2910249 RepID=UPI003D10B393
MKTSIFLAAMLGCVSVVHAHPHSWIEMDTYIQGNGNTITGFAMKWEFDAMTSTYILDGEPNTSSQTLQNIAIEVLDNMLSSHYFTYFYQADNPIKYRRAIDPTMNYHRGKITMTFDLPLSKPITPNDEELKLLIFDPSHFVDMSWNSKNAIHVNEALNCTVRFEKPTPTAEQIAYALALPIDADPDNELGQLFTETLYIKCENHDQ